MVTQFSVNLCPFPQIVGIILILPLISYEITQPIKTNHPKGEGKGYLESLGLTCIHCHI